MDRAIGFPTPSVCICWKVIYDLLDVAIHCLNDQRQVCTPLSVACGVRNEKTVNS